VLGKPVLLQHVLHTGVFGCFSKSASRHSRNLRSVPWFSTSSSSITDSLHRPITSDDLFILQPTCHTSDFRHCPKMASYQALRKVGIGALLLDTIMQHCRSAHIQSLLQTTSLYCSRLSTRATSATAPRWQATAPCKELELVP
jgi:hypothetical protein